MCRCRPAGLCRNLTRLGTGRIIDFGRFRLTPFSYCACRSPCSRVGWHGIVSVQLGITLLILGLVHMPLPSLTITMSGTMTCRARSASITTTCSAGILRPARRRDVAFLHWHWFLPSSEPDGPPASESGPAIHAYAPDWQVTDPNSGPQLLPDTSSSLLLRLASRTVLPSLAFLPPAGLNDLPAQADGWSSMTLGASLALHFPTSSLLQRWDC